ncbi:MAG: ATP-binding protein, partial [Rhizonema sp. PD37]|nr:ATP-binding protein [Rhizonema sp. PD37]
MLACATIAANGISGVSLIITICVGVLALLPEKNKKETLAKSQSDSIPKANNSSPVIETDANSTFRLYRQDELKRICASLLANGSILVTGEQGSGKSVLAWGVVEKLREDGFTVAFVEPATTKQMLVSIAEELGVETQSKTGKSLTTDQLKQKIENSLKENQDFLIVDDCQNCDSRFRHWLKQLKKLRVPILLL